MKPSDSRLQHAKVWSAAKLLQRGTVIIARFLAFRTHAKWSGRSVFCTHFRETTCKSAIVAPTARDLAILSSREGKTSYNWGNSVWAKCVSARKPFEFSKDLPGKFNLSHIVCW